MELAILLEKGGTKMAVSNPHYTIDGIADLIPVIDDIERRLAAGERP